MTTYHLDLDFSTNELVSPVARVYIKRSTGVSGDSLRYISPDCASPSEFDEAIKRLHAELDNIQNRAHIKFATEREKLNPSA